jgi:alpha-L-rhamnosidase
MPDLWDSQKVPSPESDRIVYNGKPLHSRLECWWQVRVWDRDGKPSAWSKPAFWRMGLLQPSDWHALWIGAPWQGEEALPPTPGQVLLEDTSTSCSLLRKTFYVQKKW